MDDPVFWHRLQFAFTAVYHYLFPQLTMGLALLIVALKALGLRTGRAAYDDAARFWIRLFGLNFALGVVTGLPMEFQFGTNWARFTQFSGGVVGQTLALEGMVAFFLESAFLGLLVFGERRLGRRRHFLASLALFAGSWASAYFVIVANAFLQHPAGHVMGPDGTLQLASFRELVLNPWALAQFAHNQMAAVVTASFVMAATGAFWTLRGRHAEVAGVSLRLGVSAAFAASLLVAMPTGHHQGRLVAEHQKPTLAAMEGRFKDGAYAEMNLIGQPDVEGRKLDNPIRVPGVLSYIAYGDFSSNVQGLESFPADQWPANIEMLYYSFHIMVGLGTLLLALSGVSLLLLLLKRLERNRAVLWVLMLAFPFPYIANTAGWMTAELGRQPWLIYGLMRTVDGASPTVHGGQAVFTSLGFAGLYFVLGLVFLYLVGREIGHGPAGHGPAGQAEPARVS